MTPAPGPCAVGCVFQTWLRGLGDDAATVDGVHLTDRGFRLMADGLAPIIERIILRNG